MKTLRLGVLPGLLAAALGIAGCTAKPPAAADAALARAREFLLAKAAADGTWHSGAYSSFNDGASLTPLVLIALHEMHEADTPAFRRGVEFLSRLVRADGSIDVDQPPLSYPVYTAALAVRVLSLPGQERYRAARDAWISELRRRQLDESLGWMPADDAFGGWGYCHAVPRKPQLGNYVPPLLESNLSATVFALDALHAAGVPSTDPAFQKARIFVERCQNFADSPAKADPQFDDGGFYFIYADAARNKPGPAGRDAVGRERFLSYGSMTADGCRALRLCGLSHDHPRVVAARSWLTDHFSGAAHVGEYPPERSGDKDAVYFYYAWALAQSLPDFPPAHAIALAEGLLARQQRDGSWRNLAKAQREDEPVLATAMAAAALARCRPYLRSP